MANLATIPNASASLRTGRDLYLTENGFTLEMYDQPSFKVPVAGFEVSLPNPTTRRKTIPRHDLHHVLTGYGTDWIGEAEVSAWECGAGLGSNWVAWSICVPFFVFGLVRWPRRIWRAFQQGRPCRSLFVNDADYEPLLDVSLAQARMQLGLPGEGVAEHPAGLNAAAPA